MRSMEISYGSSVAVERVGGGLVSRRRILAKGNLREACCFVQQPGTKDC
jgi:hypothetical protein